MNYEEFVSKLQTCQHSDALRYGALVTEGPRPYGVAETLKQDNHRGVAVLNAVWNSSPPAGGGTTVTHKYFVPIGYTWPYIHSGTQRNTFRNNRIESRS
jgi:hypothetical protein